MPNYESVAGVWKPKTEYHVNPNAQPGENPVYQGPDRAALEQMKENGLIAEDGTITYMGSDIFSDPEMMVKARQLNCKDVNEYLTMVVPKWDKTAYLAKKEAALKVPFQHDVPTKRTPERKEMGGGFDQSGNGKSKFGGFGDPEGISSNDITKRAK